MSQEDRAQDQELLVWKQNNERKPTMPTYAPTDAGYGPQFCSNDECGDDMPLVRRQYGRRLCTRCQEAEERRKKGY